MGAQSIEGIEVGSADGSSDAIPVWAEGGMTDMARPMAWGRIVSTNN